MPLQIRIAPLQALPSGEGRPQEGAGASAPPLGLHRVRGHRPAVETAPVRRAVDAAGEDVLQQRFAVGRRPVRRNRNAELPPGNLKYRRRKDVGADLPALTQQQRPVHLAAALLRPEADVQHLPDAEAAVDEVLQGVEQQEQQMVVGREGQKLRALDGQGQRPLCRSGKEAVEVAQGVGIRRKERLVDLQMEAVFRVAESHLKFIVVLDLLKSAAQQRLPAGREVLCPDQQVFVPGGTAVRHRIEAAADDALDDQRTDPRLPQGGIDAAERRRLHGLHGNAADRIGPRHLPQLRRRSLPGGGAAHGLMDHGAHLLPGGQAEQSLPVLCWSGLRPVHGPALQAGPQGLQQSLSDLLSHMRSLRGVRRRPVPARSP